MNVENSRRQFIIRGMVAAGVVPFMGLMQSADVQAQALKPLPVSNPQAMALKYVTDASKAVGAKPGSNCSDCALHQTPTNACAVFPGFSVSPKGWCSAWAKKG